GLGGSGRGIRGAAAVRVMHLMAGVRHGGAETCFEETALALARSGLEQRAVIRHHPERAATLDAAGIPTLQLGFGRPWLDLPTRRGIAGALRSFEPAIVMAW